MNIFYLDNDTKICAQYHHDVHLRKMIIETAQLLSTAHHKLVSDEDILKQVYRSTHANHPSAIWARNSKSNYFWLNSLLSELITEYEYRFNKTHKTKELIEILSNVPKNIDSDKQFEAPPLCMPDEYKSNDSIISYRNFYRKEKMFDKNHKFMGNYTNRQKPEWL